MRKTISTQKMKVVNFNCLLAEAWQTNNSTELMCCHGFDKLLSPPLYIRRKIVYLVDLQAVMYSGLFG